MTHTRYRIIDATTPGVPRDHDRFNVNGPSVLPTPGWMPDPPGRYLMFFAHHVGQSIRLAAADEPTGPWRMVDADVLNVDDTPSDRQPHIASPMSTPTSAGSASSCTSTEWFRSRSAATCRAGGCIRR